MPACSAAATAAQGTLERMAVRVDEAGQREGLGHGRILSRLMATRAVSAPLQQLPNALTIGRLVLIPIFVALMLSADGGHSWPAVIVLFVADHMPWAGLVVIVGRDLLLLVGWKAVAPEGYELNVNLIGKAATWLLYAGIAFLIVTHRSTDWPYWIFWTGLVLAVLAGAVYAAAAWREF